MLRADKITVYYGGKAAVDQVELSLEEGQWLMLCGPNGAGKSTLLGALAQTKPYRGHVQVLGMDAAKMRTDRFARVVGVLSQHNDMDYAFSVEEVVRMGRYAHRRGWLKRDHEADERAVSEALAQTGLSNLRTRSVLTLSGGELQRVFLAQVLSQQPQILLLDEPANHLDLKFQQQLFEMITEWLKTPGRAVVSVVHDLSLARMYGTHALLMRDGRCIAQGEINRVLSPDLLEAVYDVDVYAHMARVWSAWKR